jgi:hypothetical protein
MIMNWKRRRCQVQQKIKRREMVIAIRKAAQANKIINKCNPLKRRSERR